MAGSYERSLPREARKARGVFYTPQWVVDYIVERVVRPGDSVLDLACGDGAFLCAALRVTPQVTGVDIDADALKLAPDAATLIHGDALLCDVLAADVVIGNPPYLSIDDYGLNTPELQARYADIYRDKTDLSYYFLARAVELAKRSIGMIVSRAFVEAYKADKLRQYLSARTVLREMRDLSHERVFDDAGIGTCILILDKREGPVEGSRAPWVIVPDAVRDLNAKIDAMGVPAGEILVVGQGMQTGRNEVFRFADAPPEMLRKRASNTDIQRGFIRDRGDSLLYLEDVGNFDDLPASVRAHLLAHRGELEARAAFRRGDCQWWKYTWPLHKDLYGARKRILCPYLASSNRFAIDADDEFLSLTDTTVLFDNGQPEPLEYICALLNSRLLEFRFRTIGKHKGHGIREYFWNSVSRLPVRRGGSQPESDEDVYALYGLTPAEISMVGSVILR